MKNTYPTPSQAKPENLQYGLDVIAKFCKVNKIKLPKFKDNSKICEYGFYLFGSSTITYNLKRSRVPVKTPGFSWSYTGYKADLTVAGVLAHEFGHYLDDTLKMPSKKIKKEIGKEKKVSSYEPNTMEVFAESVKLFVLNPDLLRVGRPKRYKFLIALGLKPVIADTWQTVLGNAHPKFIAAATNWAK